jgi:hypothetical protein
MAFCINLYVKGDAYNLGQQSHKLSILSTYFMVYNMDACFSKMKGLFGNIFDKKDGRNNFKN